MWYLLQNKEVQVDGDIDDTRYAPELIPVEAGTCRFTRLSMCKSLHNIKALKGGEGYKCQKGKRKKHFKIMDSFSLGLRRSTLG